MIGWICKETRDGENASFRHGNIEAYVQDMDGDGTYWWVKLDGNEVAKGAIHNHSDFQMGLAAAWAAIGAAIPQTFQH